MAAELLKRLFLGEIQPKLFPGNSFLTRSLNDDAFVNVNTVELPHSGTLPDVAVNRTVLPAPISKRTDAATQYALEELTTDPTLLQDSEGLIVAYNKRASILSQHALQINTKAADRALYKWAAGATGTNIVATTGTSRAAGGPSQTGNRNSVVAADIINIQQRFFADDVQNELGDINGIAVITPRMYSDLLKISDFVRADSYGNSNIPNGVVRRAFGFDFYVRSRAVVLNASDALKAEGAAASADDQDAAVFYSPSYVRRALGSVKVFINTDEAEYYGSVFSAMVRFGAAPARNDNKGVYLLFENNA